MKNALLALLVSASVVLATSCGKSATKETPKKPVPSVTVEKVTARPFTRTLPLTGSVEPTRVATLSSPAEGPVMQCTVREGDQVQPGQVLLKIGRDTSASAAAQAAVEEEIRQQREFDRVSALVQEKALPGEQLDIARSGLEKARAAVALARQVSSDYEVTAPWSGVVARVHIADGKYVSPRAPLIDLFDPQSLVLRFQAAETFADKIAEGDQLEVTFDALSRTSFPLRIVRAYPEVDRRLRMRTYEAALPLDTVTFRPGFFARITASLKSLDAALTVPVEAVVEAREFKGVLYVVIDGKAQRREVELGFEQEGRVWVREGLTEGDRVIVEGMERVSDGSPVRGAGEGASPKKEG